MYTYIQTLTFAVYKMVLTNLLTQPFSILGTKLWKVVITMFFDFCTLLLKIYLFKIATFFVALYLSSQLSFISGSSNVKGSCFSWSILSSLQLLITLIVSFSSFSISTIVKETKPFNTPIPQYLWLSNMAGW